jgi:hypothetical protein
MNEKELVRNLKNIFEDAKYSELIKIYVHTNLATKKFHELWKEWWKGGITPKLEVDMILIFRESQKQDVFMPAIEIKYFKDTSIRDFREGLQQALSFSLFGFDSLVLWHIFPEQTEKTDIDSIVKPMKELISSLNLPLVYFATRIKENKFEFSAPWEWGSSIDVLPYQFLWYLKKECEKTRNPLFYNDEIQKRRKMLKVLFKIPI